METLRQASCIVLIGMPNSGKTTLGKKLAKELSCDFVDIDHLVQKEISTSIEQFIKENGFTPFRQLEYLALEGVLKLGKNKKEQVVISTGGGCVEHPDTKKLLSDDSLTIIYLKRDLVTLKAMFNTGLHNRSFETVFQRRDGLYKAIATHQLDVDQGKMLNRCMDTLDVAG